MNKEQFIRGTSYGWSDITINIGGNKITGVKAINYKGKQAKQNNYAAGNMPYSRGRGNKEFEGSLQLFMEEIEGLQAASPSGDLTDIPPFDIVVAFMPDDGKIITHTLKYVEFMENGRDVKQGDMEITPELPLIIGSIDWGK